MKQHIFFSLCVVWVLGFVGLIQAAEIGDSSPDCQIAPHEHQASYALKHLQGKVVYVDFWASWCGPCAKSFPFLNALDQEFNTKGLQIIGINLDEQPTEAADFLAKYPAQFTIASGDNQQCAENFAVKAMPSSYLIDRKGHIRHIHLGFKPDEADQLKTLVNQLLAE